MMITLRQLCQELDTLYQVDEYKDYCPIGLQVEGKEQIQTIATGVSASVATIEAAVEMKADVLIVHHGMFWEKDSYQVIGPKKEKLKLLLENEISLLAYHLPMDGHPEIGNNWYAAKQLGWNNLEPFMGIGVKGEFSGISREAFQKSLEDYYQHPATTALGGKEQVTSAALISGGAYRSIPNAALEGVDCFITGNFDEPAWHMALEEKVNFFALGHSATERVGPIALKEHLVENLNLKADFLDLPNPF